MSAGHLSRQFRLAYGEDPYGYLMTRRIARAMALLRRGDLSVPTSASQSLLVVGHLQHSLHRVGRYGAQHLPAPRGAGHGRDTAVRGETGDQTDQESRRAVTEAHLA